MEIRKYFDVRELVPPDVFAIFAERSLWQLDPKAIAVIELLRDVVQAPVRINNWHTGGKLSMRGYRPPNSRVGSKYSQHKRGCAFDVDVRGLSPRQIIAMIEQNGQLFFDAGLTTIEDPTHTPTWLHLDTRQRIPGIHKEHDFLFVAP